MYRQFSFLLDNLLFFLLLTCLRNISKLTPATSKAKGIKVNWTRLCMEAIRDFMTYLIISDSERN